jgi:hypothetical protein
MITISSKAHRTSKTCKSFFHRLTVGKHHPKRIIRKISTIIKIISPKNSIIEIKIRVK